VGFLISALRRSSGSSCTTPPGTRRLLTGPRYRRRGVPGAGNVTSEQHVRAPRSGVRGRAGGFSKTSSGRLVTRRCEDNDGERLPPRRARTHPAIDNLPRGRGLAASDPNVLTMSPSLSRVRA
jgi:hypothetical protein